MFAWSSSWSYEYFISVSAHLPNVNSIILDDLADDYSTYFVIDPAVVENRLYYKAAGPDGLPNWLLRDFAPYLSQPLAAIFNAAIRLGYVPPVWKSAEVIPAPKLPRSRSVDWPAVYFTVTFSGKSPWIDNKSMAASSTGASVCMIPTSLGVVDKSRSLMH